MAVKDNTEYLLEVKGLSKEFSGKRVVDKVNFTVRPGEIVALIGENGAGKSTVKNMLCGLLEPTEGSISFKGRLKGDLSQEEYKVAAVHQELSIFNSLSVAENVCITNLPGNVFRVKRNKFHEIAEHYLDLLNVQLDLDAPVETLGPGEAQLVEIAKALYQNPELLILDEPTASLTTPERNRLFEVMRNLKKQKVGMIFVTHFIDEVYEISDKIIVLRNGVHVGGGSTDEISRKEVEELLVGREMAEKNFQIVPPGEEIVLRVSHFSSDRFTDVNFEIKKGEILGIAGLMGAGRTEIAETIYGLRKLESGTMELYGEMLSSWSPGFMKSKGVAFISEERKVSGIFPYRSIKENLTCATLSESAKRRIPGFGWKGEEKSAVQMAEGISLNYSNLEFPEVSLSGGNQQKSIIARWMALNPKFCIFDDPTRGVDIGAKEQISELIAQLARQGCSILLISSDVNELIHLCHRIKIMRKGKMVGEVNREEFKAQEIISIAATTAVS